MKTSHFNLIPAASEKDAISGFDRQSPYRKTCAHPRNSSVRIPFSALRPPLSVLGLSISILLAGCVTTSSSQTPTTNQQQTGIESLTLPAWMTAPDVREQAGVPVDLEMTLPERLRPFEYRYALPPWMIYGTVRALGLQRMHVKGDIKSYSLEINGQCSDLPEQEGLVYFVPESDIHRALMKIVKNCADAKDEEELNRKIASYIQCLYKDRYALFTLNPSAEAFGRGASRTVEIFKSGRDDLPTIGWVTADGFIETTLAAVYDPDGPIESFHTAEELAIRDLAAGAQVKLQSMERMEDVSRTGSGLSLTESAIKESFDLELRGVRVVRRVVDVDKGICLVAVRVRRSGIVVR